MSEAAQTGVGALTAASVIIGIIIAIVTAYVAWRQMKMNRRKQALELYDRRLKVYTELRGLLSHVFRDATVDYNDIIRFREASFETDFLFGPEVRIYLDEVIERSAKLSVLSDQYESSVQRGDLGEEHKKLVAEKHEHLIWLTTQRKEALRIFKPYLDGRR